MQNDNQNDIFFFNDTATTEIYTLSLHDALPISGVTSAHRQTLANCWLWIANYHAEPRNTAPWRTWRMWQYCGDRKSTRLNSSHGYISYAVFCLKKKTPAYAGPGICPQHDA